MQNQSTGSPAAAHQQEAAPVVPPATPAFLPPQLAAKNNNNKLPSTVFPNRQQLKIASNLPILGGRKGPLAPAFLQKPQVNQQQNMNTIQQIKPVATTDYQYNEEPAMMNNNVKDLTIKMNNANKSKLKNLQKQQQPINEDEYDR